LAEKIARTKRKNMSDLSPQLKLILTSFPPTLEEELEVEKDIRELQASTDINELKLYVEAVARCHLEQQKIIARCFDEIHVLKAKLACATPVKKKLD
tara:strand:+ start:782 stop:1072 length:291 start_codon:yes stop_codon:yes gene_type:complete